MVSKTISQTHKHLIWSIWKIDRMWLPGYKSEHIWNQDGSTNTLWWTVFHSQQVRRILQACMHKQYLWAKHKLHWRQWFMMIMVVFNQLLVMNINFTVVVCVCVCMYILPSFCFYTFFRCVTITYTLDNLMIWFAVSFLNNPSGSGNMFSKVTQTQMEIV